MFWMRGALVDHSKDPGRTTNRREPPFWVFTGGVKRQPEGGPTKILALFELHPLYGPKRLDYLDLCLANKLFLTKKHLTVKASPH